MQNQQLTLKFPSLWFPGPFQGVKTSHLAVGHNIVGLFSFRESTCGLNDEGQINICSKINLDRQDLREGPI